MPPKARYNDKARAGGLSKAQAIRDARKHGRKLPQGEAPKSKKQKRLDKYIDAKLRNDEKVKLIKQLSEQPKTEGMSSTKVMKRTKGQDKKQEFDTFTGFDDDAEAGMQEGLSDASDDSELYLSHGGEGDVQAEIKQATAAADSSTSTGTKRPAGSFGFGTVVVPTVKKAKRAPLKYNWRAKLEEDKRRKAGIQSESDSDEDSDSSAAEEEEDSQETSSDEDDAQGEDIDSRRTAFRTWAAEQTGSAPAEFSMPQQINDPLMETYVPRPRSKSPEVQDTSDLQAPSLMPVVIQRTTEIEESRAELPAYAHEQEIVEKIKSHSTVIISGATGSGKTTQIPQFLYEAGFKGIGVTQPRRVAAVSMARRVATELGSEGHKVGYQIRFESNVKSATEIKFMTDGVLLRELSVDFMLTKYEVLIIDEAHERSINTDILIGVLSRVIRLRKDSDRPLRLIIMSATLRVADFAENKRLFSIPPPIMSIEARQYPVTIHFSRRTEMSSYVEEAYKKICKIHAKLPPGGILVFLTGQQEIQQCAKLLTDNFGKAVIKGGNGSTPISVKVKPQDQALETEDFEASVDSTKSEKQVKKLNKDDYDSDSDLSDIEETEEDKVIPKDLKVQKYVQVLPLYSLLPTTEQMKVFQAPPDQCRQIILATNVAETSLTIPGIRYVIDSGRAKARRFNGRVQSFEIDWISKASADQRSGRAGRTGPGHAYRLFSSAVYDSSFPVFSEAEILNTPIDGIVLQMKSMNIHTIVNFPFPTPPDRSALSTAEKLLVNLGALDAKAKITELGRQMSLFPLTPRFAKMVVIADQQGLMPYVIALVAAMSVDDPFLRPEVLSTQDDDDIVDVAEDEEKKRKRQAYFRVISQFSTLDPTSDAMRLLMAVCAFDYTKDEMRFCTDNFLRPKAMTEIRKLRTQISNVVRTITDVQLPASLKLTPPSADQIVLVHKILGAGYLDQICARADLIGKEPPKKGNILRIPYVPLSPLEDGQEHAFIHPSSLNIKNTPASAPPEYLLYSALSASANDPDKVRIKVLSPMEATWIAEIAQGTPMIKYGKPLISSMAQVELLDGGRRRRVPVIPTIQINGSGRQGWSLPPIKITQKLVGSRWVDE